MAAVRRAKVWTSYALARVRCNELIQCLVGSADFLLKVFQLQDYVQVGDGLLAKVTCVH